MLNLNYAQAADFDFTYEASSNSENEFNVDIELNSEDIYDVKVFIHDSPDEKVSQSEILSQIKNGQKWQSSWNYIISAFPAQKQYRLKLNDSESNADEKICVRLRKTGASSFNEICKPFNAENSPINNSNQNEEETQQIQIIQIQQDNISNTDYVPEEKIFLNAKKELVIPIQKNTTIITNEEKLRLYLLYAFCFFSLITIILLSLRKL